MELAVDEIQNIRETLEQVWDNDQKYRASFNSEKLLRKYGKDSKEVKAILCECAKLDEINLEIITNIINKYGWLGEKKIGFKANMALFLVIQHSSLEIQLKYLPIIEQAVKDGNLRLKDYAIFKDRIEVEQNNCQIYGSQLEWNDEKGEYQLLPIIDPEEVDERRKAVGLEPMVEALARYGLDWEEIKHKNTL